MLLFKSIMLTFSVLLSLLVVEVFLHARPGFVPMSVRSRLAAGGAFLDFQGVAGSGEIPGVRYPSSPNQSELMTVSVSNLLSSIKVVKEGDATSTPVYRRTTDAQGLCNPSNITGKVHCLFIGDSFTEMSHLPWEQRWPAQLALAKGWSLRNLGKGGISPAEGVRILQAFGAVHQPDLVIFSIFEGNDPWDEDCWVAWQASGLPYTRFLVKKETFQNRIILFKWYEELVSRVASWRPTGNGGKEKAPVMTFLAPFVDRLAIPKEELGAFRGWKSMERSIVAAKAWCDAHGSRLELVLWPSREHIYALQCAATGDTELSARLTGYKDPRQAKERLSEIVKNADAGHQLLLDYCGGLKIPFYYVGEPLQLLVSKGVTPFYLDDIHPNREGNRAVAEYLAERDGM